ncbi:MAG: EF-P lysine aminoacylase GenX [Planctomycetia bacterium]|nr:EF-P lysine aminoacylase GenX [Planctomycetia bacterium]
MTARPILELRARVRRDLRGVFDGRGFLEVDTPVLSREVLPEAHIDPIAVRLEGEREPRFLQASPEALMKRLLARAAGPIYQFAQAFRAGERGGQHDVEFILLEWYEPGGTLDDAASLIEAFCTVALGTRGIERVTCLDAFTRYAAIDPFVATAEELEQAARRRGVNLPEGGPAADPDERWDRGFELLLAEVVQPQLGRERPTMLVDWPASQAAFARIDPATPGVARRFELFVAGVELANGWEEETSREVLAERIGRANTVRAQAGRTVLPLPERLLAAHGDAMPAGFGAALGFDRLVMLAAGADSIAAVRCFTHEA